MKGEINRDWYCNQGHSDWYRQSYCTDRCNWFDCPACHRKHPTPEQFKEEYGEDYPDDDAVWITWSGVGSWWLNSYYYAKGRKKAGVWGITGFEDKEIIIICACTPWGKPPDDWRPE